MSCDHNLTILEQSLDILVVKIKEDRQNDYFLDQDIWKLEKETLVNAKLPDNVTFTNNNGNCIFIKMAN